MATTALLSTFATAISGSPLNDVAERVNDIYMSVVESEECMQRVACEVGGLAKDVGLKDNGVAK